MIAVLGMLAAVLVYIVTDVEEYNHKKEVRRLREEAERAYYGM